jgi:hypothetical protein
VTNDLVVEDALTVTGNAVVTTLGLAGATDVCRNAANQLSTCSSSLRYKSDVRPFLGGLDTVGRLRPIAFTWRDGGTRDVGFGAEDVAAIEPLLATYDGQGHIEGVKYKQLTTVLVNAVQQQQTQIAEQQRIIEALRRLVCQTHDDTELCRP